MNRHEPIRVSVDVTNPGQFFACCGLLELADRAWDGAEGWFRDGGFNMRASNEGEGTTLLELIEALAESEILSTMTPEQTARLKSLKNLKKTLRTPETEAETAALNLQWEKERLGLGSPFEIWLDWWNDDASGGGSLKTWAGKQLISDLVAGLHASLQSDAWKSQPTEDLLFWSVSEGKLPLYFNSDIGGNSSTIDVGFSMDKLDMRGAVKPLVELLAFFGLQRFRPMPIVDKRIYRYSTWAAPLPPLLAALVCNGGLSSAVKNQYEFRLLYRTKYLKSFLPAVSVSGESE